MLPPGSLAFIADYTDDERRKKENRGGEERREQDRGKERGKRLDL